MGPKYVMIGPHVKFDPEFVDKEACFVYYGNMRRREAIEILERDIEKHDACRQEDVERFCCALRSDGYWDEIGLRWFAMAQTVFWAELRDCLDGVLREGRRDGIPQ